MAETLVLLTAQYPYGKTEAFLENEIKYIADAFQTIYLIPLQGGSNRRAVPANVAVIDLQEVFDRDYSTAKAISKLRMLTVNVLLKEYAGKKSKYPSFSNFVSYFLRLNYKAVLLESFIRKHGINSGAVFYSYWFEEWATILSLLKLKGILNSFISRAHGFDLYEERNSLNHIPFRDLQLEQVKQLFLISDHGLKYISSKYPMYSKKCSVSYLGVHDYGINPDIATKNQFVLVSCSNLVSVKRVNIIVEALIQIDFPLKWVHFGDGPLLPKIESLVSSLPENILVQLKGRVSNAEVLKYYRKNPINLFINVSESEGLPVSIMEAISFGIPVLATDVGGTAEIVKAETGILIEKETTPSVIAAKIKNFRSSLKNTPEFRKGVRVFWEHNFDATSNYPNFISELKNKSNQKC